MKMQNDELDKKIGNLKFDNKKKPYRKICGEKIYQMEIINEGDEMINLFINRDHVKRLITNYE